MSKTKIDFNTLRGNNCPSCNRKNDAIISYNNESAFDMYSFCIHCEKPIKIIGNKTFICSEDEIIKQLGKNEYLCSILEMLATKKRLIEQGYKL